MFRRSNVTGIIIIVILLFATFLRVDGFQKEKSNIAEPNYITFSRIDKAWEYTKGEETRVAVLDWLFDTSPEALKKYENPTSLVPGEPIGSGEPWHGEWMAEIVHRIAPDAKIIPIRARPSKKTEDNAKTNRQAYEKYLIEGIRFAADQGAVAVTNSMGPVKHSKELRAAIDYAEGKGTVFINVHPNTFYSPKTHMKSVILTRLIGESSTRD